MAHAVGAHARRVARGGVPGDVPLHTVLQCQEGRSARLRRARREGRHVLRAPVADIARTLENATKKTAARKEAKKVLEERFKTGKSRWFFTRLAF